LDNRLGGKLKSAFAKIGDREKPSLVKAISKCCGAINSFTFARDIHCNLLQKNYAQSSAHATHLCWIVFFFAKEQKKMQHIRRAILCNRREKKTANGKVQMHFESPRDFHKTLKKNTLKRLYNKKKNCIRKTRLVKVFFSISFSIYTMLYCEVAFSYYTHSEYEVTFLCMMKNMQCYVYTGVELDESERKTGFQCDTHGKRIARARGAFFTLFRLSVTGSLLLHMRVEKSFISRARI
jgi:hypothetical protein